MVVHSGNRIRLLGPVLAIEAVTAEDGGTYKCSASNAAGEASAELRLTVTTALQVDVVPSVVSVHMAGTAEFRCIVNSNGSPVTLPIHLTWYKDGRQLPNSDKILRVTGVGREDKGMYQCVVRRQQEGDTFQATAELQLGGKIYHCLNLSSFFVCVSEYFLSIPCAHH